MDNPIIISKELAKILASLTGIEGYDPDDYPDCLKINEQEKDKYKEWNGYKDLDKNKKDDDKKAANG